MNYDLSPSGEFIIFSSNHNGTAQLFYQIIDTPDSIQQLTFDETPITNGKISPHNDVVLFRKDIGGTEMDDLYVLNLSTLKIDYITDDPKRIMGMCWAPNQTKVARATVDETGCQIEIIDVKNKKCHILVSSPRPYVGVAFSPDGKWISTSHITEKHTKKVEIIDIEHPKTVFILPFDENSSETAATWSHDGKTIALITDITGSRQFALYPFPSTKTDQFSLLKLEQDEEIDPDCDRCLWCPQGGHLIYQITKHSQSILYKQSIEDQSRKKLSFPLGYVMQPRISSNGQIVLAIHSAINSPKEIYLVNMETAKSRCITTIGHKFDFSSFPPAQSIWYESFDGRKIHAWYYPPPSSFENSPAIVSIHGGPHWQHFNSFDVGQSLLTLSLAGYAVIAPNIRGSTGYGNEFQNLNKGDIAGGDLEDVDYAVRWLKNQPEIDIERIACFGPSYGGYLTLMALTKKPTLFAAGISFVPLTDLVFLHEKADPAYRGFAQMLLGGPLEDHRDLYIDRSPITHVSHIQAPILIGAARGDSRCPFEPIQLFVDQLRAKNHPHRFLTQDDMGHASVGNSQNFQEMLWNNLLSFLDEHLGKPKTTYLTTRLRWLQPWFFF